MRLMSVRDTERIQHKTTPGMVIGAVILAGYWYLTESMTWWIVTTALFVSIILDAIFGYEQQRTPKIKEETTYRKTK